MGRVPCLTPPAPPPPVYPLPPPPITTYSQVLVPNVAGVVNSPDAVNVWIVLSPAPIILEDGQV